MKQILLLLTFFSLVGCLPTGNQTNEATPSGCGKDTDCKGDRVCNQNVCQEPQPKSGKPREGRWLKDDEPEDNNETNENTNTAPPDPSRPGQKTTPTAALESAVLSKMNEYRASKGLSPLKVSSKLQEVARAHSEEMFNLGYFSHKSPTPGKETFIDRIKLSGLTGYSTGGENIIYREGISDEASLADVLLKQWLDSPPHKANILSPDYFATGLGFYRSEGRIWGTQVFVDRVAGM